MKTTYFALLLLLISPILWGQKTEYVQENNIPYYNEAVTQRDSYIKERCVLDIYYPKNSKGFATIIWFHGGGLSGGNKEILSGLKEKGFAIIGVNYRLSPKVKVKNCIEDAAASVAWTFKNSAKYGGDSSLLFMTIRN